MLISALCSSCLEHDLPMLRILSAQNSKRLEFQAHKNELSVFFKILTENDSKLVETILVDIFASKQCEMNEILTPSNFHAQNPKRPRLEF